MNNKMITCEVCGKQKSQSEMSKSYTHRCKDCVAEQTREMRRAEKSGNRSQNIENDADFDNMRSRNAENRSQWIKVLVKDTGETVMVKHSNQPINVRMAFYETKDGRKFMPFHLQFEKDIDWEQRRYEIAKSLLPTMFFDDGQAQRAFANSGGIGFEYKVDSQLAKEAVRLADALIEELKKKEL